MLDIMKTFDGNFFVAVTKEDKVVGTIGFRENPENNTFEVLSVSVDRKFRKKGIASKMMTEMEKEADKRGRNVFVTTTFQNVGACGLYRSRGYIESRLDLKRCFFKFGFMRVALSSTHPSVQHKRANLLKPSKSVNSPQKSVSSTHKKGQFNTLASSIPKKRQFDTKKRQFNTKDDKNSSF